MIGKQGYSSKSQEFDPTMTLFPGVSKAHFSDLTNRLESRERVTLRMEQRGEWGTEEAKSYTTFDSRGPRQDGWARGWKLKWTQSWKARGSPWLSGNPCATEPPTPGHAFKQWVPCLCGWLLGDGHWDEPLSAGSRGGVSGRAYNHLIEESFEIRKKINKTKLSLVRKSTSFKIASCFCGGPENMSHRST